MKKGLFTAAAFILMLLIYNDSTAIKPPRGYIQYFGQACFLITAPDNVRIVTDPPGRLEYSPPDGDVDIVTVSHDHFDHNNVQALKGRPVVLRGLKKDGSWNEIDRTIRGVRVYNVGAYHDDKKGAERGLNSIFVIEFMGLKLVHAGDLGHVLDEEAVKKIGRPDALLLPVGGHFTIGPKQAWEVVKQLDPKIIIPMHYQTAKTRDLPIQPLDPFISGIDNVVRINSTTTGFEPPERQEVWVLQIP